MAIKIEQLNDFLGYGIGKWERGEYFYSQGMTNKRGGIEPGWLTVKQVNSSSSGVSYMGITNWFAERLEGITVYTYAIDDNGDVFKTVDNSPNWARLHVPGTASSGNGLITDHSGSQRVLYIQDEYIGSYDGTVWYDTFKDLGWSSTVLKDADIYEDWVVIGNSSTVAILNVTDDSFQYDAFTLPKGFVIKSVKSGQNGVLIGANINNRGALILWDCQSDRSIAPWLWTDGPIYGIAKYGGMWIVSLGREFVITNGYSILKRYRPPDMYRNSDYNYGPPTPAGMIVKDDQLFICSSVGNMMRSKMGIHILNLIAGLWEFCPVSTRNTYVNNIMGGIFLSSRNRMRVSWTDMIVTPYQDYIGFVNESAGTSWFISAPAGTKTIAKKRAEAIILDIEYDLLEDDVFEDPDWSITAKIYDFSRALWQVGYAGKDSTDRLKITVNGSTVTTGNHAEIGDEITMLDGNAGGDVREIVAIANPNTTAETWTVDRSFRSLVLTNDNFNLCPFKVVGIKNINSLDIKDTRLYFPIKNSIMGRKFFIKLDIEREHSRPRIRNLWFVYDELGLK